MEPIEVLMSEHRSIEVVLDALETYADRLCFGGSLDPADLGRFVEFIRGFADRCHHGKEEDILFTAMVEQGLSREGGPIAVMLSEHDQGRAYVKILAEAATDPDAWQEEDRQRIRRAAGGYAALLRQHIQKEDGILYPMAQSVLAPPAMDSIARRFEQFEKDDATSGESARLRALGESLAARYAARAPGGA